MNEYDPAKDAHDSYYAAIEAKRVAGKLGDWSPGYILAPQQSMFGAQDVVGFGTPAFSVAALDRDLANAIIEEQHYSHRFVGSSRLHLGVSIDGRLVGVLQLGVAMNPQSMGSIMAGCTLYEYLELNRMWLHDDAPRNSESRAISYAIKYIRRKEPKVRFIQSFADERCGLSGTVYQAANFLYCGSHQGKFWEIDGEFYHDNVMTNINRAETPRGAFARANKHRAVFHSLKQYRYIYLMQPRFRSRLLLKVKPYPKEYHAARPEDERGTTPCEAGVTPAGRSKFIQPARVPEPTQEAFL